LRSRAGTIGLPSRDRARLSWLAGAVTLAALLVVGLVLIDLVVDAEFRQTATRLVAAAILAMALYRVRTVASHRVADQPASTLGVASEPATTSSRERTRFDQLHDEVRFGAKNRRYFDAVLWPHLVTLAETKPDAPAPLEKPPARSLGRGPSLDAIARLIAAIETRR
jgi:hypothetical protein